jgi:hypothetical protein
MLAIVHKDWVAMPADRQVTVLKKLKPEMLCSFVRRIDPLTTDVSVLRWIAARQEIDLATALTLFFNFNPRKLTAQRADKTSDDMRNYCSVMDVLCQRINCGFYIPMASRAMDDPAMLRAWLDQQAATQRNGHQLRWTLSAKILEPMLQGRKPGLRPTKARPGLIQGLFTPLFVANRTQ